MVNKKHRSLLQLKLRIQVMHARGRISTGLDGCCGSGSGVIAALRMGYNAAGFDIAKEQVEATKVRIKFLFGERGKACNRIPVYGPMA